MKKLFFITLFALSISNPDLNCMPKLNYKNIILATIGTAFFAKYSFSTIKNIAKKDDNPKSELKIFEPFEKNFNYLLNRNALDAIQEKLPNPLTCIYKIIRTPINLFIEYKKYKKKKQESTEPSDKKNKSKDTNQNKQENEENSNLIQNKKEEQVEEKEIPLNKNKFKWKTFSFGIVRAGFDFFVFNYVNKWLQKKLGLYGSGDMASLVATIGLKTIIPSITDNIQDKLNEIINKKAYDKDYFICSVENLQKDVEAQIGYNLFELGTMICPFSNAIDLLKDLRGSFSIFSKFTQPIK